MAEGGREDGKLNQVSIENIIAHRHATLLWTTKYNLVGQLTLNRPIVREFFCAKAGVPQMFQLSGCPSQCHVNVFVDVKVR